MRIHLLRIPAQQGQVSTSEDPFVSAMTSVIEDMPDTWKAYPDTPDGAQAILDMESDELRRARTFDAKRHELVHVAAACMKLWERLNDGSE